MILATSVCAVLLFIASRMNWNPRSYWHDHWSDPRPGAEFFFAGGATGLKEGNKQACFVYLLRSNSNRLDEISRDHVVVSSDGVRIFGDRFDWPRDPTHLMLVLVEDGKVVERRTIENASIKNSFTKNRPIPLTLADELWHAFLPLKNDRQNDGELSRTEKGQANFCG
jgi:hypothetical protein